MARSRKKTPVSKRDHTLYRLLLFVYAISGFASLALENLWIRRIALWAGNTVVACTLVVVVFFAAAATGTLLGAWMIRKSARPLVLFGRFEVAAGVSALLVFAVSRWVWDNLSSLPAALAGEIGAALLLVVPPALFAAAGFPCLAETYVPGAKERTANAAPFYAANLIGAACGVVVGGVLLPWYTGVTASFFIIASLQILGGCVACWISARTERNKVTSSETSGLRPIQAFIGWMLLAASGFLSLLVETLLIVWARQILQGSIYCVSAVLAAFIGGLGLGATASGVYRRRGGDPNRMLVLCTGTAAILLFLVPWLGEWFVRRQTDLAGMTPLALTGYSVTASMLVLLPLTFTLGTVFPLLWEAVQLRCSQEGIFIGLASALNKVGAAAGTVVALFVLIPVFGLWGATLFAAWSYFLLAMIIAAGKWRSGWILAVAGCVGLWQTAQMRTVLPDDPDLKLIEARTGAYGPVAVIENRQTGSRQILLNTRQRLSGTRQAMSSQLHQSWAPLLFARSSERVATIGMAAGISSAAVLDFPVREAYAFELVPEVVKLAEEQFNEWNSRLFTDPRSRVVTGDGRLQVARLEGKLDLVICDLLFPAEDGTSNLYSREFFEEVRRKLSSTGTFCLWLPCYQHDVTTAGITIRTFMEVFPHAVLIRSNLNPTEPVVGILGAVQPIPISREFLQKQLDLPCSKAIAERSPFFHSPENALLLLVGDLQNANPDFSSFPLNTDDHPLLAFLGPREGGRKERLIGMAFLNWIGKRFTAPKYPSCEIGTTNPEEILKSVRAGNYYFAAAVANSVLPGDPRPESKRLEQVAGYVGQARSLAPAVDLPLTALGQ